MRIITGKYGGRKINPPSKMPHTRPTTDVAKEGLFNIIENNREIEGVRTLDLFGGTGSITYELASRGAGHLTIVEKDPKMYEFIKNKISELRIEKCKAVRSDVFRFLDSCEEKYDLIFAGPPYALGQMDDLPQIIRQKGLMASGGWFILEHTAEHNYEKEVWFKTMRHYGMTQFSIFVNQ